MSITIHKNKFGNTEDDMGKNELKRMKNLDAENSNENFKSFKNRHKEMLLKNNKYKNINNLLLK